MNTVLQTQTKPAPVNPSFARAQAGMLQRKYACGESSAVTGECEECRRGRLTLQRFSVNRTISSALLRSMIEPATSTPLSNTIAAAGVHSGHNFGQVIAYTRSPHTIQTKLAVNRPGDQYEQEADRIAEQVTRVSAVSASGANRHSMALSHTQPLIQRQADDATTASPEVAPTPAPSPTETAATEEAASTGLIVEDDAREVGPGQMRKSDFLDHGNFSFTFDTAGKGSAEIKIEATDTHGNAPRPETRTVRIK